MEKAGDILKEILNILFEKTQLKGGENFHTFFLNWEKIMGQKLSQHSKPIDVRDHFLYLEVDHPGWLQLIQINEKSIIKRINTMYPQLKINFVKIKTNCNP